MGRLLGNDPTVIGSPNKFADQMFFLFGAQAIDRLVDMLDSMPSTVLIGKLCPVGMEAQIFAILAALSNFGSSIAYVNASIVQAVLGIKLNKIEDDLWECSNPVGLFGISSVGWLKLLGTAVLPLMTVPFTWCCLPDLYLNDNFFADDNPEDNAPGVELGGETKTQPMVGDKQLRKSPSQAAWVQAS